MPCFKSIIFIKIGLNLNYFCQKNTKFSSAGGSAPRPPCLRRLGALPPDPQSPAVKGYAPTPPTGGPYTATSLQIFCHAPDRKYAKQICATSRRLIINILNFEIGPIENPCLKILSSPPPKFSGSATANDYIIINIMLGELHVFHRFK